MIGSQHGNASGLLQGVPAVPFTNDEQQRVRQQMEKIQVPYTDQRNEVTANSAKYILDGPWGEMRTGFAVDSHF
jgi:hypothetical protein